MRKPGIGILLTLLLSTIVGLAPGQASAAPPEPREFRVSIEFIDYWQSGLRDCVDNPECPSTAQVFGGVMGLRLRDGVGELERDRRSFGDWLGTSRHCTTWWSGPASAGPCLRYIGNTASTPYKFSETPMCDVPTKFSCAGTWATNHNKVMLRVAPGERIRMFVWSGDYDWSAQDDSAPASGDYVCRLDVTTEQLDHSTLLTLDRTRVMRWLGADGNCAVSYRIKTETYIY